MAILHIKERQAAASGLPSGICTDSEALLLLEIEHRTIPEYARVTHSSYIIAYVSTYPQYD